MSWTCFGLVQTVSILFLRLRSPARGERGWRGVDARPAWRDRLGDGFAPRLRDGGYGATGATARQGLRRDGGHEANLRRSTFVPSSPPVTPAATLCCRMTLEPVDRLGLGVSLQPADDVHRTTYLAANLIWNPDTRVRVGIEYLYGLRENVDGGVGVANRIQCAFIFDLP